ncbi:hypothetical protein FRC19_008972 [Serendipita sp. 401]|nr:hypothetical protein FRC19_008972 [Serendipita sp. 401]KAG9056628.1 hypothetical protein FS842_010148 [Serendipita sp. 407]
MKTAVASAVLLALASKVAAVAEWGQCGGMYYTGSTTCDAGLTCVYSNDWYSQCLKSTGPSSTSSTRASSTSTTRANSSTSTTRASSSTSTTRASSSTSTTRVSSSSSSTRSSSSSTPTVTAVAGNPYTGKSVWTSSYYAAEVDAAAAAVSDSSLKTKILKVKDIPTFTWFDTAAKVDLLPGYLTAASGKILQIVVYDLPNRDCHANASNGEYLYANNGANLYIAYIDKIANAIKASSGTTVVAVIEPDSLANLVTNLSDSRCSSVQDQYKASVTYALKTLATAGVYMYMDAGHAGWLGWPANISPAATMFIQMWTNAGKSPFIRGLATNVANYNALTAASPDPVTPPNPNYDETHYINALAPMLASGGWNAQFIVDQGRSGVQNIRSAWGNWCNIKGAGFGLRPTTNTGNSYIDAIVWIKPGGECDGTSNTSAVRYDSMCGGPDAKVPAPEAGQWFQAYFVDLVNNANPAL